MFVILTIPLDSSDRGMATVDLPYTGAYSMCVCICDLGYIGVITMHNLSLIILFSFHS